MKLYKKKLDSLEALKREKIRLRYQRMHTKSSDLNPLSEIGGKKAAGGLAGAGILGLAGELMNSKSNAHMALTLGKPLLRMLRNRRRKQQEFRRAVGAPEKDSMLKKLVKEIAINYFIGKAVQLGLQKFRQYRRQKKAKTAMVG